MPDAVRDREGAVIEGFSFLEAPQVRAAAAAGFLSTGRVGGENLRGEPCSRN